MSSLLKRFNESNEIMYTSFLARHFYRIIKKHPVADLLYSDLLIFCEQIIERHKSYIPTELNRTQSVMIYNSKQFYQLANTFFTEHIKENKLITMHKLELKSHMNFRKLFNLIDSVSANNQLIIYPYSEQKFLLITTEKYWEALMNNRQFISSVIYIGAAENTKRKSFY